jgi:hypothetical protein
MSLKDIAAPLIAFGIPVVPAKPGARASTLKDWPNLATTDPTQIEAWDSNGYHDWNLVCVAKPDQIAIGDLDRLKAARAIGFPELEQTLTSKSPHGYHLFFTPTDRSRALGNVTIKDAEGTIFELKSNNLSVCAPGCTRDDGGVYKFYHNVPPIPFPDELADWIEKNRAPKTVLKGMVTLDEDFDWDDFVDFFELEPMNHNGDWHSPLNCPVKGAPHTSEGKIDLCCGFYYDGEHLGWKDLAAGCDGSNMTIGGLIAFMNEKKGEKYTGAIWPEDEVMIDADFEDADAVTSIEPSCIQHEITPTEKCYKPNCACGLEHATLEHEVETPVAPTTEVTTQVAPEYSLEMPESCMRGKLGELARAMQVPLGFAYPAILAAFSAKPLFDRMLDNRLNLYVVLVGSSGAGKSVAIDRAVQSVELRKNLDYLKADIGGDMQLTRTLGDHAGKSEKRGSKPPRIPGFRKLLLQTSEINDVLGKTTMDCSTLASKLCGLWDDNEYIKPDGKDNITVNCRLSWIGGLPADEEDTSRFVELFSQSTAHGLYQRFLIGYTNQPFTYRPWHYISRNDVDLDEPSEEMMAKANNSDCGFVTTITDEAQAAIDAQQDQWAKEGNKGNRLVQNAMKIACLTASASGRSEVDHDYMVGAIEFMNWQAVLRTKFVTSQSELNNRQAAFADSKLLPALIKDGALTEFRSWRRLSHDNRWHRKIDADLMLRTVEALLKMGTLIPEPLFDDDGDARDMKKIKMSELAKGRVKVRGDK